MYIAIYTKMYMPYENFDRLGYFAFERGTAFLTAYTLSPAPQHMHTFSMSIRETTTSAHGSVGKGWHRITNKMMTATGRTGCVNDPSTAKKHDVLLRACSSSYLYVNRKQEFKRYN